MPKPTDPEKQKYMFTDDIKFLQKADEMLSLEDSPEDVVKP